MSSLQKTALFLTGGGARAAYQVGVLQAIYSLLSEAGWPAGKNPFDIVCGTSAGAINATAYACRADDVEHSIGHLLNVWRGLQVEQVYRADSIGVIRSGARWLSLLSFGWLLRQWHASPPNSLLDNSPLVTLLHTMLDLPRLDAAIARGHLHALAVSTSSYTAGRHVVFYQSNAEIAPWSRIQRMSVPQQIGVDHLLASSAIPLIFPSVPLYCGDRCEYFGDGSLRELAPVSPAIHLGADRILVIGAGNIGSSGRKFDEFAGYPSLAQIAGHAMSSIFLDGLSVDLERMARINQTLSLLTPAQRQQTSLRPIEMLAITPSKPLDSIASEHIGSLPLPIRTLLSAIGATERRGAALASYLLFESSYTRSLIELGQIDTLHRRDEVLRFFEAVEPRAEVSPVIRQA
ncbi:MAG: patatin-like phospholipase family protein [Oxalobacteraceae bacterium]|nr:patatin-like phospholipase family protein [Oxalobacteraceae bacterium]NCW84721.1 patatin-like phospholipase family protein [Oxalobacteraceae bacterium]